MEHTIKMFFFLNSVREGQEGSLYYINPLFKLWLIYLLNLIDMFLSVDKKSDCYLFSFKIMSNYNKGCSLESTYSITLD